jgi:hypothetical protein
MARRVSGNSESLVSTIETANERGIHESSTGSIQLGYKRVESGTSRRFKSARRGGEIRGRSLANI